MHLTYLFPPSPALKEELYNANPPVCSVLLTFRENHFGAAAALERQEPFINSTLAQHALALLARLFRYGRVCYHGGFINLSTGIGSRLPIDASLWRRLRKRCESEKTSA